MQVSIRNNQLKKLADAVEKAGRSLPKELAMACNKTAREMKTPASKEIRKIIAVKAAVVKKVITQGKKASNTDITASFSIQKTERISLRNFGAKQTKQGVTYKIDKRGGRKRVPDGFIVQKLYGQVFKRKGKERFPIQKLWGPSPWGVVEKNQLDGKLADEAEKRLEKDIDRRIQYNVFKASEL